MARNINLLRAFVYIEVKPIAEPEIIGSNEDELLLI